MNEDLSVDLPLTDSPVIEASALTLGLKVRTHISRPVSEDRCKHAANSIHTPLKGEFYSVKTHQDPPFKPQPFTLRQSSAYMLSAGLSDFTVNSASYGYFSAGLFQTLINDSLVGDGTKSHGFYLE